MNKIKNKVCRALILCIVVLTICIQSVFPVSAMTVYESDGVYHEEGYIFVGESHSAIAAHAVGVKAEENGKRFYVGDGDAISFEYCWDSSREVTPDGGANTFTMKGNMFFVFEGNAAGIDDVVQTNKQYIFSDGKGNQGVGVRKIHEIIDSNPNIAHWNIISFHGGVSAAQGTKEIADYYANAYRNWIEYEFPQADCYFLSVATMTKYYKSTADKKVFNNTLAAAFPDKFLDYTDFYAARSPQRMIDTIHWDDATYVDLISDVICRVKEKKQETNAAQAVKVLKEYTVTDVQAVLYTNDTTVIYAQPSLTSDIILSSCETGIPIQVTGITSNGFFRICISSDGTDSYVAGSGLSQLP